VLTKPKRDGILTKLSDRNALMEAAEKEILKKMKKVVDK